MLPFTIERTQFTNWKHVQSLAALTTSESSANCPVCKTEKHPFYSCQQFKVLPHYKMLTVVRGSNLCLNCLRPGHLAKNCKSNSHGKKCQRLHYTFLHIDSQRFLPQTDARSEEQASAAVDVSINAESGSSGSTLLMTCQMLVHAPDGYSVRVRGLLDSGSRASFISERMAQTL